MSAVDCTIIPLVLEDTFYNDIGITLIFICYSFIWGNVRDMSTFQNQLFYSKAWGSIIYEKDL